VVVVVVVVVVVAVAVYDLGLLYPVNCMRFQHTWRVTLQSMQGVNL